MNTTAPAPVTSPLGQRASFQKECRLLLQGVVTADTVEGRLARYYKRTSGRWPLLFDFTNAEYVEVAALGNVIAYVMDRREKSLLTFLAYPRSKAIRDFFTVWRFPDALSQATGMPFTEFLLAEDQLYLEEEQSTYDGIMLLPNSIMTTGLSSIIASIAVEQYTLVITTSEAFSSSKVVGP